VKRGNLASYKWSNPEFKNLNPFKMKVSGRKEECGYKRVVGG
jgi:hypothetical protein